MTDEKEKTEPDDPEEPDEVLETDEWLDEAPDYAAMAEEEDKAKEEALMEAMDYVSAYDDIILTHADFIQTAPEDLVPEEISIRFEADSKRFLEIEEAILERDRQIMESAPEDLLVAPKLQEEPSLEDLDLSRETEEQETEQRRIPPGIVGRLFTIRKKGWKDKIWEVTPGGAKSGDKIKPMDEPLIQAINRSKGFVVLSGKDYDVVTPRETENKLIDAWRSGQEKEIKKKEEVKEILEVDLDELTPGPIGPQPPKRPKPEEISIDSDYIKNLPENITYYGRIRMPEHNPEAFKILSLMSLSSMLNGKYIIRDGWKDEIYPNLYVVIVGPPSTQKSSSFMVLKKMIEKAAPNTIFRSDWTKEALGVEFQTNPAGIAWVDEFAQLLDPKIREGYKSGVLEFVVVIYDDNEYGTHRIDTSRDIEAEGVNIGFGATIQTERFYKLVTEDDVNTGFFNRFCYVVLQDRKSPPVQTHYTKTIDYNKNKITKALNMVRMASEHVEKKYPVMFSFSEGSINLLNTWYAEVDTHCRSFGGMRMMSLIAISSRIYTMAKKAALIYEVLDRVSRDEQLTREPWNTMPTYEISEENTKKGIDFAKMCFKNSEYLYLRLRSTDVMVKLEKFKDVIKPPYSGAMVVATPEGNKEPVYAILKSDMMRHLGMKLRDFNDYFNTFVEMKRFATATVKTKTKKGTIVFSEVPKDADETAKWVAAGLKYKQSKKKQKHPN